MGELLDYIKDRYMKQDKSETKDMMEKTRVKNTLEKICADNLKDVDDTFTFEVHPRNLQYVVSVIEEEPIKSKYEIVQISPTLFSVRLLEVEL